MSGKQSINSRFRTGGILFLELVLLCCVVCSLVPVAFVGSVGWKLYSQKIPKPMPASTVAVELGVQLPIPPTARKIVASKWAEFIYGFHAVAGEFDADQVDAYLKQLEAAEYEVTRVKPGDEYLQKSCIPSVQHGLGKRAAAIDPDTVVAAAKAVGGAVVPNHQTDFASLLITHTPGAAEAWFYLIVWHD